MAVLSLPTWTKPWKVVTVAMAVVGFVNGYVGTAGAPYCGSMGQCLQRVVDAGPPWFYPAALIPGVIAAAIFGAFVYLLFLLVYGTRAALHRPPAAPVSPEPAGSHTSQDSPAARLGPEQPAAAPHTDRSPVRAEPLRRARPSPLVIAIGAALVWAVLSVGPGRLLNDVGWLVPKDTVTAPACSFQWEWDGTRCRTWQSGRAAPLGAIDYSALGGFVYADKTCSPGLFADSGGELESDGMCHVRSGGTVEPLMDDVVRGGQAGLLAFLAVGAALLIWPRLQRAGTPAG